MVEAYLRRTYELPSPLSQRMAFLHQRPQSFIKHMSINLCCGDIGAAEACSLLHDWDAVKKRPAEAGLNNFILRSNYFLGPPIFFGPLPGLDSTI